MNMELETILPEVLPENVDEFLLLLLELLSK